MRRLQKNNEKHTGWIVLGFAVLWLLAVWLIMDQQSNQQSQYPSTVVSPEKVEQVLSSLGYEQQDLTAEYPNIKLKKNISVKKSNLRFEFFAFKEPYYTDVFFDSVHTDLSGSVLKKPDKEQSFSENGRKVYALTADGKYNVIIHTGDSVIYAGCFEENKAELIEILKELDCYYDEEKYPDAIEAFKAPMEDANIPTFTAVIVFAIMIPLSKVILKELWNLVCAEAYTTPAEVLEQQINWRVKEKLDMKWASRRMHSWMLARSGNSLKFRFLYSLYSWGIAASPLFLSVSIMGCFIKALNKFLLWAQIIVPLIIILTGVASVLYSRRKSK